jgi:hypothetical protein
VKFNIAYITGENPYEHLLYDLIRLIDGGLTELGHNCVISKNHLYLDRTNIIIGGHLITETDVVEKLKDLDYIVLQSEIFKNNTRYVNAAPAYKEAARDQFDNFYLPLMKGAQKVWEAVPSNTSQLDFLGVDYAFWEGGYAACLENITHKKNKDIDFLFFGSLTEWRKKFLTRLDSKNYNVVWLDGKAGSVYRNDAIARAKINLSINQTEDDAHLAWGRVTYLLNNRGLVVGEETDDMGWLSDCYLHALKFDDVIELCEETLNRSDREEIARKHYELFRQMPITDQLSKLIEATR